MSGIGKLLGKGGDIAMQVGVGRKKYTPGVGTELADQGLIGTKGQLQRQTSEGLSDVGSRMAENVAGLKGQGDSRQIGQDIYDEYTKGLTRGGKMRPSGRDVGEIQKAKDFAEDVMSRGATSPEDMLGYRGAAGSGAFSQKSGEAGGGIIPQLSKMEQQKYSRALKEMDPTGKQSALDSRYAALAKAKAALSPEDKLSSLSAMGLVSKPLGVLGGALPATAVGQAGVKGGKLAEFLAPLSRQAAVGGSSLTSSEARELEELENSLRLRGR
jgi:hypothetical protein